MARARHHRGRTRRVALLGVEGLEAKRMLSVTVAEYPTPGEYPSSIAAGADGNLWFVQLAQGGSTSVASYNPTTKVTTTVDFAADTLAVGPDGDIWASGPTPDGQGYSLVAIDPASHAIVKTVALPSGVSVPNQIIAGPGSDVAFTAENSSDTLVIGLVDTTTGVVTIDPTGLPVGWIVMGADSTTGSSGGLAIGPDGNVWFTYGTESHESGFIPIVHLTGEIGILDPTTGALTTVALPTDESAGAIVDGPDGNLYFTAFSAVGDSVGDDSIDSINPATHAIAAYPVPGFDSLSGLAVGPDGNLWFIGQTYQPTAGSFDPSTHAFAEYPVPSTPGLPDPQDITAGPGDTLWFTDSNNVNYGAIGVINLASTPAGGAVIGGTLYGDPTAGGVYTSGESPLAGATVYVDLNNDSRLDPGDPTAVTGTDGSFSLPMPAPGTYSIRVATPGLAATGGGVSVTIASGQTSALVDLGAAPVSSVLPLTPGPQPFGTSNPDLATAEVTGLYRTILGRAPDAGGLAFWTAALNGGTSLATVAYDLLHSAEYESDVVASYYENYLGRAGSASEVAAWVGNMQRGMNAEQVAFDFLASAEFNIDHADNGSFVQALYNDALGRQASASDVAIWEAPLAAGISRAVVALDILDSVEAQTRAVEADYTAFLGRAGDAPGIRVALGALANGLSLADLATFYASSAEYINRARASVV